ncbi:MAG: fasciclin domain-containing protein, partial [Nonlabens sp.]|nr:fasciclin domain-containing protein [Nonlabens sp.]
RNTLLNHVVSGNLQSTALTNGYVKTSATNGDGDALDLYVDIRSGVLLNGVATVTAPNNIVSNGVIHVVDEVIALPTVVTLAVANPDFSNLVTAVGQEGLVPTLNSAGPFTVFAPLNSSFDALIAELPSLNNINDVLALTNLTDVLTYHVLPSAVRAEDITNGITPSTVQGGTFTINTTGGVNITDGQARVTPVLVTNVTATNGVVHAIGRVLLP